MTERFKPPTTANINNNNNNNAALKPLPHKLGAAGEHWLDELLHPPRSRPTPGYRQPFLRQKCCLPVCQLGPSRISVIFRIQIVTVSMMIAGTWWD